MWWSKDDYQESALFLHYVGAQGVGSGGTYLSQWHTQEETSMYILLTVAGPEALCSKSLEQSTWG